MLLPWQVLSTQNLLDGSPWLRVSADHVRLPNGVEIPDFYRITMPDWAQIFAVTEQEQVALIEHYKHGPGVLSLELPAGYLESGEAPESAARRELLEETGLEAPDWQSLGRYFMDGNRGCGTSHIFLARRARVVAEPQREATEIMTQHWLSLAEVRAAWLGGRIQNMGTIGAVGLALAALEGDR
ncbi:MAG: NUDIX hydrolase [Chloroflexi bacterium]|nr:NUDIX hydrolase [Chloroflexota bacterium]